MSDVAAGVRRLLTLPRQLQPEALERLLESLGPAPRERWNTAFGPDSLFDTWTRTTLTRGLYAANALALRPRLQPGWRALEIGGGDGRLWASLLTPKDRGWLAICDPAAEVQEQIARRLPGGVEQVSLRGRVEEVELPGRLDVVVCSLTLHHVAGRDAAERASVGMSGPGKREVLERIRSALKPDGLLVLNEADVFCEVELPPGDELLVDNMLDSYVRRCARALLDEPDDERIDAIVHLWCLEQVRLAHAPIESRDVYELDVTRWVEVLESAGFQVRRRCTDPYGLFWQYLCSC